MSKEQTELVPDDNALFEVVGFLMDRLAATKDPRIADIANFAISKCQEDSQVVAKLVLQINELYKQRQQVEPYNPFQPPVNRQNRR